MPPSQRSSGRSADESSGGRVSGASTKYIDIDIGSDMVGEGEKRSHTRSDGRPPAAGGKGHTWYAPHSLPLFLDDLFQCERL